MTLQETVENTIGGIVTKVSKTDDYTHVIVVKDGISLYDLNRLAEKVNDDSIMLFSNYDGNKTKLLIDY